MSDDRCQAQKRVWEVTIRKDVVIEHPPVRCDLPSKHDGMHSGAHALIKGPSFSWARGKQRYPAFVIRPKYE